MSRCHGEDFLMILHRQQFPVEIKLWFLLSFVVLEL